MKRKSEITNDTQKTRKTKPIIEKIVMCESDLDFLDPGKWLNDNIISFYMK